MSKDVGAQQPGLMSQDYRNLEAEGKKSQERREESLPRGA